MTDRKALLELVDRCEREEPSRELDAAIHRYVLTGDPSPRDGWVPVNLQDNRAKPYTTSLDAAVTLVPEGKNFDVTGRDLNQTNAADATIWAPLCPRYPGVARTPALALCAAALRALASQEKNDE